jgi:flagellar basal-body rod protein FlgF
MNDIYVIGLTSAQQDFARVDRVALNLANMSTPGYKREVVALRPFADVLMAENASGRESTGSLSSSGQAAPALGGMQVLFDVRPGSLKQTGQPFDLALTGDGFFEVATPSGPAYTRQGDFHLDQNGRLVTALGDPVMGMGGEIYLTTRNPSVDTAGNITEPYATTGPGATAPGRPVAQIKVVHFENSGTLQRLGNGLLASGQATAIASDNVTQIRQGALENSNVDSMHEMVQLLQTVRHFESMQRIVQGYDELLGTAIRKLGDLS